MSVDPLLPRLPMAALISPKIPSLPLSTKAHSTPFLARRSPSPPMTFPFGPAPFSAETMHVNATLSPSATLSAYHTAGGVLGRPYQPQVMFYMIFAGLS